MNINEKAKELAFIVMSTNEFAELKQAKSVIDKDKELKKKIVDFKNKEKYLFSQGLPVAEMLSRTAELEQNFKSLSALPGVNKYLKAEANFYSMLNKVYRTIGDFLDADLKS